MLSSWNIVGLELRNGGFGHIMVGDINAKSPMCYLPRSDPRGELWGRRVRGWRAKKTCRTTGFEVVGVNSTKVGNFNHENKVDERRIVIGLGERHGKGERSANGLVKALKESQSGATRRIRRGGQQAYWFNADIAEERVY